MKILYIAHYTSAAFRSAHGDHGTPGFGGLRKVELVCEALSRAGHEVVLASSAMLAVSRWRVRPAEEEVITCGAHRVRVIYPAALELKPLGGLANALRARRIADRICAEFEPDLVLLYNTSLFEFMATRGVISSSNVPVFVEVEDLPLARRREWGNLKPRLDQRCWPPLLARASGFTAVNEGIRAMLPPGKPAFLLPGIVDDRLRTHAARRRPPFTGARRTLGYFGGLTADKGVGVLLDLAPVLPEPWDVVVCGSGPLAPLFAAAQAAHPERFRFRGTLDVDELYAQMCACDCTLVPPERIEGSGDAVFPFKLLEYLTAGTHIVSPRLKPLQGSVLEFVQRWDGRVESLPGILERAAQDHRADAESIERASRHVMERYSVEGVARLFDALFAAAPAVPRPARSAPLPDGS